MIYRIEVRAESVTSGENLPADPLGETIRRQITEFGPDPGPIRTRRIFLIDSDANADAMRRVANELLANPIAESADVLTNPPAHASGSAIEIHLKPGVMDPVAASTEMAIRDMGIHVAQVRTGRVYLFENPADRDRLRLIAARVLANGVIESVHFEPYLPVSFETGHLYRFQFRHVAMRNLNDERLVQLSREGHLFLSLPEMKAIQAYYREQGREPTDVKLETLAQTWSEHCVHKTLKSAVDVEVRNASGKIVETRRYGNLIKETIFASTKKLMEERHGGKEGRHEGTEARTHGGEEGEFCLSVFSDNAGVIAFDETDAVCFKVETHNHPSAIEPYGGSATGVGGVIRDILGTGLGARPVANTDVFCVASHDYGRPLPRGVIHPKRVLQQVVAGVRDYGNRMGIPTVNGAVYFDDRYLGNPLVFCGCVGLIPRDRIHKEARPGDAVVVVGGRTGRDGIHGATFSSAELTDTHADEFSHAVQIGNAITEKKVADVILEARDRGLFTAITDCGAGGLSSAVGEMGEKIGADISLERIPLKYAGLRHDEIWISEAQERMVLSAPKEKLAELLALAAAEDVEATVIGHFGTDNHELILRYHDAEVARLSVDFLHHGIPMPTRKAVVETAPMPAETHGLPHGLKTRGTKERLLACLSHPNAASKHWIIRQYDHEVQGGSVIKPLTGPRQIGPSDAAVLRPKLDGHRGVVLGCGLSPQISDPYEMTLAAIDEAVRNVVAVGADLSRVAILDNFCWPSVDDEKTMGTLVRACEACRDAALAYGIPFISGKDSLHNQFTNQETGEVIRIPRTLLISAIGVIDDVRRCITMDLKKPGDRIGIVSAAGADLAGRVMMHRALSDAIRAGLIASCHDSSDGGILTAAAEMCIASGLGMDIRFKDDAAAFRESCATYVIEFDAARRGDLTALLGAHLEDCGCVMAEPQVKIVVAENATEVPLADLTRAWRGTLDW